MSQGPEIIYGIHNEFSRIFIGIYDFVTQGCNQVKSLGLFSR